MLSRLVLRPALELGYLIAALGLGVASFTVVVAGLATSLSLVPVALVGVPLFGLVVLLAHVAAVLARSLTGVALDEDVPVRPRPRPDRPGILRGPVSLAQDADVWKEAAFGVLLLPLATLGATAVMALWSAALAGLLLPLYIDRLPGDGGIEWLPWSAGVESVLGVLAALALAPLARVTSAWAVRAHVGLMRGLLAPGEAEALRARVSDLQETRARVVDAADAERRRIERDLHDGPQQHLVSLAMLLGRAQEKLGDDPAGARILVAQAHAEAKESIAALRDVVRGVHPAVLTDRGLDAALSAIAARSPVPVRLRVDLPRRPSMTIEAVAYFVVSEALTNAARHAGASRIEVDVELDGDRLLLHVADDGRGGASDPAGGGLAGLRDRVAAVDGTFRLASPPGGGTALTVELPCAS